MIEEFNKFFAAPKEQVITEYQEFMQAAGCIFPVDHLERLHDLGYLPICIRALPEGTKSKIGVPLLTIWNTHPDFYWLVNFLETMMSMTLWKPLTSATTAHRYKKAFQEYADKTSSEGTVLFQGHDFSMRGMSGLEDAQISGAGHLTSFCGTDTVPAIRMLQQYYGNNLPENYLIGASVPATEHSVMCLHGENSEQDTFEYLLDLYPEGILSVVSDTWNLWDVLDKYLPALKDKILNRKGKLVIRPDSGDPVKITLEVVQRLYKVFGGTKNSKGYIELNPAVGMIYGDSITLDRQERILSGLEALGFASTNVVLGIGSFTYEYVTRDTYGFAMKATFGVVDGKDRNIYKDPITDSGEKKSAKGLLRVVDGELEQECSWDEIESSANEHKKVFENGQLLIDVNIQQIRERLNNA